MADEAGLIGSGPPLASEDVLRGLLGATQDCVVSLTLDGLIASVNRPLPGLGQRAVVGQRLSDLLSPGQRERLESVLREVAHGGQIHELEVSFPGVAQQSECVLRIGPISSGLRLVGYIVVTSDFAARRGIEAELRESQNKLRIALAASRVGMWSWDAAGDTVQWDAATRDIFGAGEPKSYEEYMVLVHPDDRDLVARHIAHALEVGEYHELEHRIVRPDGAERWVLARADVVKDATAKNRRLIGGILDISERRSMEDKLRQAQKMEALGELTAGLAHNFNNALMAILPNLEHAAKGASPQVLPLLEVARQAAERAARLVGELMVFAGGGRTSERRDESLGSVVQRAVAICRSTFSRQIAVELAVDEAAPILSIDAAQIEHAVINVCINARDALEAISGRSPTLRVHVTEIKAGAEELRRPALKPERDHARISV
ncbi:MAG TPA: PAS domain S-box protein, partial [Polyangiaceae bacterium]|nr:PAS domain S-box protein [Polyangiaceae bacterium]